jgi:hypothetical protein
VRFFAILAKKIKVAIILYFRYNCHLQILAATEWQMRATTLPPFAKLAIFPATTRHIIANLHFFLPPRGNSVPPFATFLNGGNIFAGREARWPLAA